MSIDLDDISSRIATGIYGDDRLSKEERNDAFSALAEIIADVERLRAEVTELRALGVSLHKAAAAGRDAERDAMVAWLREQRAIWMTASRTTKRTTRSASSSAATTAARRSDDGG